MKPLASFRIAWVTERTDVVPRALASLRHAGAEVRVCHPHVDLWVTLGAAPHDLVVLAAGAEGLSGAAVRSVREQLATEARTRDFPVLCLVMGAASDALAAAASCQTPMIVWDDASSSDALVEAVADWVAPYRWVGVLEERERLAREEARLHAGRLDEARIELSDVSHDLRAFMSIILGFACNLRDHIHGTLTEGQADEVERILSASRDATALLDRIKDAARPATALKTSGSTSRESHRPARAQRELLDLRDLTASVAKMLTDGATRKQISLKLTCREPVEVWGDALKLKQLLSNLIGNAIKYTPPMGRVHIEVRASTPGLESGVGARRGAEIIVRDSGPGIAPEDRDRIFERGVRLARDSHLPGKGFGLSIVRDVVAHHGGHVAVGDIDGSGTVVKVWLPVDRRSRQTLRVLLAADSDATRALVLALLDAESSHLRAHFAHLPEEFLRLSSGCDAAVLVAGGDVADLAAALDRLPEVTVSNQTTASGHFPLHISGSKEQP